MKKMMKTSDMLSKSHNETNAGKISIIHSNNYLVLVTLE